MGVDNYRIRVLNQKLNQRKAFFKLTEHGTLLTDIWISNYFFFSFSSIVLSFDLNPLKCLNIKIVPFWIRYSNILP